MELKNLVIIQYIPGAGPETLKVVGWHRSMEKFMAEYVKKNCVLHSYKYDIPCSEFIF